MLSPFAEVDTKPELEIYADEVVASHGATVGQLDDDAVFYMRSRGLSPDQARSLLTRAYGSAAIEAVSTVLATKLKRPARKRLERLRNQLASLPTK